jgi:hypothetical protein
MAMADICLPDYPSLQNRYFAGTRGFEHVRKKGFIHIRVSLMKRTFHSLDYAGQNKDSANCATNYLLGPRHALRILK